LVFEGLLGVEKEFVVLFVLLLEDFDRLFDEEIPVFLLVSG
jgi:hypothetical protein